MNIDVRKPFNLILNDPKWLEKLFIGGLFYFVFQIVNSLIGIMDYLINMDRNTPVISGAALFFSVFFKFLIFFLFIILMAVPVGYVLQSVHNQVNDIDEFLPDWDNKIYDYFIYGIKFIFIKFIYGVIISFLLFVLALIGFATYSALINHSFLAISSVFIFLFLGTLIILCYCALLPLIFISFADKFKIADSFNIREYLKIIYSNLLDFILCDIVIFGLVVVEILLSILLVCTCVGILFIPFLQLPVFLIAMGLFSQIYLNYKKSLQ